MIDTIKFKLNDKSLELKADEDRKLLWVLQESQRLSAWEELSPTLFSMPQEQGYLSFP